jgi:glycosyltransferase involved in cell wall biosynthesis
MKKNKLIVIHPAIAPYRIDFFNSINANFDASFYFEFEDTLEQSFNQEDLKQRLSFIPKYLKPGFIGIKNLRLDVFKILKKEKPDMIFCSEYTILGFIILISKHFFNRKMQIYTMCDDNVEISRQCSGIRKCMRSFFLFLFNGIILADKNALGYYKRNLRPRAKLIYFPIIQNDTLFRQRLEQALPLSQKNNKIHNPENKTVLLYVGRLLEIKNIFFLMDVYKEIRKKHQHIMLAIVGDGPLKEELMQYAIEQDLNEDIVFAGKHEGNALLSWYNIGDIFILPSTFDRFGAVVNEALLSGCYTFCSSVAGASSLIKKPDNGCVFNPKNQQELTAKINECLDTIAFNHDPSTIKQDLMLIPYEELFDLFLSYFQ